MPLLTVIIPTYNRRYLVLEAVVCVLGQSLIDLELIVIDDGSTDGTADALATVADPRFRCLHQPNGGVSRARNLGIANASGRYLAFLDSDDLWPQDYLKTMIAALEADPASGVAYACLDQHYPDGRIEERWAANRTVSGQVTSAMLKFGFVYCPAAVIRRSVLDGIWFDPWLDFDEDYDFFLRLSLRTSFRFVSAVRTIRRIQPESLSRQQGTRRISLVRAGVLRRFADQPGAGRFWWPRHREISRVYRLAAEQCETQNANAGDLYRQALRHQPFDLRCWRGVLRQRGKANPSPELGPDRLPPLTSVPTIPKIIHQTWKDDNIPEKFTGFVATWRRHHPDWEYRLWTDADNRKLIETDYPWFLPIYDAYPKPIQRADAARCFVLHKFGGVYADLDCECFGPIDALLQHRDCLLATEPPKHCEIHQLPQCICNAFLAATPGHGFIAAILQELASHRPWRRNQRRRFKSVLDTTGPFMYNRIFAAYPFPQTVTLLPYRQICPFSYLEIEAFAARGEKPQPPPGCLVIHHFEGTWWKK
jgi:glycosyltransferase involved in cell wall biosynthesis